MKTHFESCTFPHGCSCGADEFNAMERSRDFYKRRLDLLQKVQDRMREPERTLLCDILANGQLLPDPRGLRYGNPPLLEEPT